MLLNYFPYSSSTALLSLYYCVDFFHVILEFFASVKKRLDVLEEKIVFDYCCLRAHLSIRASQVKIC